MKRTVLSLLFVLATALTATAQTTTGQPANTQAAQTRVQMRFGTVRYDSLLHAMPEYAEMQTQLAALRKQFDTEAAYNEMAFKRLFADFLQGQKDFPQTIMLKRQRALQEEMEKGIAFRLSADSIIRAAAGSLEAPIRARLNSAIQAIGLERGYECVINRDAPALPFAHPLITEDATPFVVAKLAK